ncbi:MAG: AsmA family protein [Woeseiaceae bacterium]|nr:AsmA family protein [Woeseiaceae bacterium]
MARATKIIAWSIGGLVAIFVVAAIAFRLFFDPNDFREDIANAVKERTGRELVIDGEIELQIFPWLAIDVGHTTLGNAPGFGDQPFAEFERASLSVRLLPLLLRQEATIGSAAIEGLQLNLQVNRNDVRNWSDFLAAEDAPADGEETAAGSGSAIEVSGVDISNASIIYEHAPKGDRYELSAVNLSLGQITDDGRPIAANGGLKFDVQPAGYVGELSLDTEIAFDRDAGTVTFGDSSLEGLVEGIAEIPARLEFTTAGIEVSTVEQTTSIQPVRLSLLDIEIDAEVEPFSYADTIQPVATINVAAFSPRSLMTALGTVPPETADPSALSSVSMEAKAYVGDDNVRLTGLSIAVDDTTFTGKMTVPYASNGRFFLDLTGDTLDLNRYMAPADEAAADAGGDEVPVEIPADLIKPLNARGDFRINTVKLGAMQLDNVTVRLTAGSGKMRIHPVSADLFNGKYEGDVRLDVTGDTPVLSMNESIEGVDLAKLAQAMFDKDNITGSIRGDFKLTGRGKDMGEIQRTLDGNMSFELKDGVYEGTDIWFELRRARALLKKETPPEPVLPARTKFSSVTATSTVNDGIMRNEDFVADLPFMQLTGAGSVNIPEATVDYRMRARIFEKPEALEAATPEEIEDFTKTVIPMKITGPVASPKVAPDVEELLRQRVEEEIKDKLKDKLRGIFD